MGRGWQIVSASHAPYGGGRPGAVLCETHPVEAAWCGRTAST